MSPGSSESPDPPEKSPGWGMFAGVPTAMVAKDDAARKHVTFHLSAKELRMSDFHERDAAPRRRQATRSERPARARALRGLAASVTAMAVLSGTAGTAHAALPPGNAAQQWDQIAEDTVVGSGAFQGEGFVYMAYVSKAMNGAVNPGERNGQSPDAAVTEAAYRILVHYFPAREADLTALHDAALAAIPAGSAKRNGIKHGGLAADKMLRDRADDGLQTPIASTSPFPTLPPGPGVWRLTPSAYAAPQTPWMANVRPFVLKRPGQFQPAPPPSLSSPRWVAAFNEVKSLGAAASATRTADQSAIAIFWTANVVRQYNGLARSIATKMRLDVPQTSRAARDDQRGRRRRDDRHVQREVPLPVLAAGDGDRPDVGDQ